jgi:hypothetical protein
LNVTKTAKKKNEILKNLKDEKEEYPEEFEINESEVSQKSFKKPEFDQ